MPPKRKAASPKKEEAKTTIKKIGVFTNCCFYICGDLSSPKATVTKKITEEGGEVSKNVKTKKINYTICNEEAVDKMNLPSDLLVASQNGHLIVKESFIDDSIANGQLMDVNPYLINLVTDESSKFNDMLLDVEIEEKLKTLNEGKNLILHPFHEDLDSPSPKTPLGRTMMRFSQAIRKKDDWQTKINDKKIVDKWRKEAKEMKAIHAVRWGKSEPQSEEAALTSEAIEYVIKECKWIASQKDGKIEPSLVDGTWHADDYIPADLQKALLEGAKRLENVPDDQKDWHPGSNNQVLDLVHPSLFCYVFGVTKELDKQVKPTLNAIGHGTVKSDLPKKKSDKKQKQKYYYSDDSSMDIGETESKSFQWLPSEFIVSKDGKVKIDSYINNLHPIKFKSLYNTIAKIFELFLPMFSRVLAQNGSPERTTVDYGLCERAEHLGGEYYNSGDDPSSEDEKRKKKKKKEKKKPKKKSQDDDEEEEEEEEDENDEDDKYERRRNKAEELLHRAVQVPEFSPSRTEMIELKGRRLQVIVKMANIELTPENPTYSGGSWHVEGMMNEKIVASGIYYYSSENISGSELAFREKVSNPHGDQRYQGEGQLKCSIIYGLDNGQKLNESLGSIITKEGRCIAFPNIHQHRVQPFSLDDKTKPGSRKILVYFLVDPFDRVISTATIPPQQPDWYIDALSSRKPFKELPWDVLNHIASFTRTMSMDEAKAYREELMKERKFVVQSVNSGIFEREFSLCEH